MRMCLNAQSSDPELSVLGEVTETLNSRVSVKYQDTNSALWLAHRLSVVSNEVFLDWVGKVKRLHIRIPCVRGLGRGELQDRVLSSKSPEMSWLQADLKPRTSQYKEEILLEDSFSSVGRTTELCLHTNHVAIPGRLSWEQILLLIYMEGHLQANSWGGVPMFHGVTTWLFFQCLLEEAASSVFHISVPEPRNSCHLKRSSEWEEKGYG